MPGRVLVVFSLVYILILSPMAFRLTVLLVAIGVSIHFRNRKELMGELQRASAAENTFFEGLTHLLDGFKEVKLNTKRSDDLYAHLCDTAQQVATLKTATGQRYADYFIFTQVVFYVLLGTMVFVLPAVSEVYSEQVTRIAAAILFIIGPLTLTISLIPVLRAANHAVTNITALEAELEAAGELARQKEAGLAQAPETFTRIEARDLVFIYRDRSGDASFTLGPMDLAIHQNETLLIVGGNGSGKSTMLKLLTALYYPTSGTISLDGIDIRTLGYRAYRELFAAIYSDYHLFDRLYGLPNIDDSRVISLLQLMQLEKKTRWRDGRFENQELSTGQKKRLALVISLLEDKQIYVFDEWAADQDPSFRQFFYETLLPDLKARGKTLIVATHDDRYFSVGDRVIKMELGRIVSDTRPDKSAS